MFDHVCIPSSCFNAVSLRYGCCSDYMMVMLNDITGWLKQQDIPYFITYGTLLGTQKRSLDWFGISLASFSLTWNKVELRKGAVREKDILPWTQADCKHLPDHTFGVNTCQWKQFGRTWTLWWIVHFGQNSSKVWRRSFDHIGMERCTSMYDWSIDIDC